MAGKTLAQRVYARAQRFGSEDEAWREKADDCTILLRNGNYAGDFAWFTDGSVLFIDPFGLVNDDTEVFRDKQQVVTWLNALQTQGDITGWQWLREAA